MALLVATSFGQMMWELTFDDTAYINRVVIEKGSDPHNTWSIGHPAKTVFMAAFSNPNVIATDLSEPYPVNDTSSFTIIHIASDGWHTTYPKIDIGGRYFVNSDTLTDYGYMEFSSDHGHTWLMADSFSIQCTWGATLELPVFSGNSNGWQHFYYCILPPTTVNLGDTILYRFTFITDGIQTNKDGLMFDDLHFEDWSEGIEERQNDNLVSVYPNPVSDMLTVRRSRINTDSHESVQIINSLGLVQYAEADFTAGFVDVSGLDNGIYLLKYSNAKEFSVKKFIVHH
jgi:hypothetical protein